MPEELETAVAETSTNDRSALEARTAERLAAVFPEDGDDTLENVEAVEAPAEPEKPKPPHLRAEEKVEEEAPTADEEVTKEETESSATSDEQPAEEAAPKGPTLPAAYRRSLKAYEWTDEEIDSALKEQGPGFIATAAKIHTTRSKELQQFAAAGRAAKSQQQAKSEPAPGALAPVDVALLQKTYGADEALIKHMAEPLNRTIAQINAMLPQIKATQQASQNAQLETFGKQVDTFFAGTEAADTYGKSAASATEAQVAERIKVLEHADALIAGARMQGRVIPMDDALQMAYDAVTPVVSKTSTARKEIVKSLQQRNKAISLKPQAKVTAPAPSRTRLEANVRAKLAKVFGGA